MAAAALQVGDIFAGRYRIARELASGGMGAVYEVVHTVTERRCALKVMLAHTVEREQLRKRFMQESRLAAQIGSEYIVDVLDAGVDDDTKAPYLVMELLDGEDLGQRLLRQGPLSREETVQYLWHVALALDRTHQAGIVHRDLKASNLFLTRREDGSPLVKVLDFGVAKVLTLERSGSEQRTQTVGTPIYMAPEQFRADGRISPATDIYALGMLAYTLAVGVHYWSEEHENCENPFAFASIAVHGPKEGPSYRAAREGVTLPVEFDAWFFKATSRWPQDRFPSATAAVSSLAAALGVELPQVPVPSSAEKSRPRAATPPSQGGLPKTVESPSGRLGTGGGRIALTPSVEVVALDPTSGSGSLGARGEHTEVSLSVTSGGLPFVVDDAPRQRSKVGPTIAAMALVAAVVAIGVSRWQAMNTHEIVKPAPAALATPKADRPAEPPPAESAVTPDKKSGVSIDDLPFAPPDTAAAPAPVDTSRHVPGRPVPPPRRTTPSVPPATTRATQPQSPVLRELQTQPSKPMDRDELYGRD
ncbi:MAG TPA: serine/threonine-protein kinase [Polyangiaceae bacterium]|nr:serine/threonine-protein kinase [Polyangiaceae bacterium]